MFGKLFGWGKKDNPPPKNSNVHADLPFPADWTGYTSAAALMLLIPQFMHGKVTETQWGLMVWELEKYAPAFCELRGHELLEKAQRFLRQQLPATAPYTADALAPVAQKHAARLMQGRGRDVMYFATIAALLVAADFKTKTQENEAWLMLYAQYFAKPDNYLPWDIKNNSTFYATDLPIDAQQFAAIAAKYHVYQPVWCCKTFAEFKAMKHHELCSQRIDTILWAFDALHATAQQNKGFAALFCICAAFGVETGNFTTKDFKNFVQPVFREGNVLGYPLNDTLIEEVHHFYKKLNPDVDPWVFLRVLEDAMAMLYAEPDAVTTELLLFMNDVISRVGVTAYRRDFVTKGMSIWVYNRQNGRYRQRFSIEEYTKMYPNQLTEMMRPVNFNEPFRLSHVFQFTLPSGVYGEMDVACFRDQQGNAQLFKREDWNAKTPRWRCSNGVWTATEVIPDMANLTGLTCSLLPLRDC